VPETSRYSRPYSSLARGHPRTTRLPRRTRPRATHRTTLHHPALRGPGPRPPDTCLLSDPPLRPQLGPVCLRRPRFARSTYSSDGHMVYARIPTSTSGSNIRGSAATSTTCVGVCVPASRCPRGNIGCSRTRSRPVRTTRDTVCMEGSIGIGQVAGGRGFNFENFLSSRCILIEVRRSKELECSGRCH
jgi:hypothetical protein